MFPPFLNPYIEIVRLKGEVLEARSESQDTAERLKLATGRVAVLEAAEQRLRSSLERLEGEKGAIEMQCGDKESQIERYLKREQALVLQLADRDTKLSELEVQLISAKSELTAKSSAAAAAEVRIKILEDKLVAGGVPSQPVSLNSVVEDLSKQMASAASLQTPGGRWRLSDARISLKAIVNEDGKSIRFPGREDLTAGGVHISDFEFGLRPDRGGGESQTQIETPDVTGYTSLVASRKLREAGLAVVTSYETVVEVEGKPRRSGRVVGQRPHAGARIEPGSTVELLIGKA